MVMLRTLEPLQAFYLPSFEMFIIFLFAASLPVAFVVWMRMWLGSVKDENPDEAERLQAEADREHLRHSGFAHAGTHAAAAHHAHHASAAPSAAPSGEAAGVAGHH